MADCTERRRNKLLKKKIVKRSSVIDPAKMKLTQERKNRIQTKVIIYTILLFQPINTKFTSNILQEINCKLMGYFSYFPLDIAICRSSAFKEIL